MSQDWPPRPPTLLVVRRIIKAPGARVYQAWATPAEDARGRRLAGWEACFANLAKPLAGPA